MSVSAETISKSFGASSSDEAGYGAMYKASLSDPESFWANQAKRIEWIKPFTRVKNTSFAYPDVSINGLRTAHSTCAPIASTGT